MFKKLKRLLFGPKDELTSPLDSPTSKSTDSKRGEVSEMLIKLLEDPNKDNYLAIKNVIEQKECYKPYSTELDDAGALFEEGDLEKALELLRNAMPNLLLSPSAHQFMAFIYSKLGDEKSMQAEMMIGIACAKGIMSTGDGSVSSPYVVMRTSDEHDILEFLEKTQINQALINKDGRTLDLISCDDGSKYHFDITEVFKKAL